MESLIFVAFAAIVIAGVIYSYVAAKKRREALAEFARNRGWSYVAADDSRSKRWSGTPFGQGDHRRTTNVLSGSWRDRDFAAFDYSYQTHSTDGQGHRTTTTHRFGVCTVTMPAYLPRLEVTHDSMLGRVGRALGRQDIELESEEFNRRFRVSCPDEKFAFDVLHPRLMQFLLAHGTVAWRMEGTDLLCWDKGQHQPAEVLERLSLLDEILDAVPSFVWRDHGVAPDPQGEQSQ
jgi:hypothetical protein